MMTRKHYKAIAEDLRKFAKPTMGVVEYNELVAQISLTMKEDNTRHDQSRFAEAAQAVPVIITDADAARLRPISAAAVAKLAE